MKHGLVMEGGAMRGMFTAGVLDVFMENNIVFDGAIGVSAGATFGCNYKSHQIGRAIRYNKRFAHDKRYCSVHSFITSGDLYNAKFCYDTLPNELDPFDYETYRKNPLKFYCVASDAEKGEPVYKELKTCSPEDLTWMRASASMPLVSRPVQIDGYKLLDGGMTDSIPLKYFESIGYKKNLVILTQPESFKKEKSSAMSLMKLALKKYPELYKAMAKRHEVYNQEKDYVFEQVKNGMAMVILPESSLGISRTEKDVNELERVYQEGRRLGLKHLDQVREFLKK